MAIITCAQLSILHNAFFFPPPRKAFLGPYIYHILQEALSGERDSEADRGRTAWPRAPGAPEHFVSRWKPPGEAVSDYEGHTFLVGVSLEKGLMTQMSEAATWNTLSCLAFSKKQEATWVSLTCWDVLGFPKDQAMEMTEQHVKAASFSAFLSTGTLGGAPELLESRCHFPRSPLPTRTVGAVWRTSPCHVLGKTSPVCFDVALLRQIIQNVLRK